MTKPICLDRWAKVSRAGRGFAHAVSLETVIELLREAVAEITGADGVTVARRDGDEVVMVGADIVPPFVTGARFAISRCISGLAMLRREAILVPEIRNDPRVPLNAYLATFVSTVAMFPVGHGAPVAAIGVYWKEPTPVSEETLFLLDALTRSAGAMLEGLQLRADVEALRAGRRPAARIAGYAHAAMHAALH